MGRLLECCKARAPCHSHLNLCLCSWHVEITAGSYACIVMLKPVFNRFTYFLRLYLFCGWCHDLVFPCMASLFQTPRDAPVVSTTFGKVRGIIEHSRLNRRYFQYLQIPYAQPPTGNLRFEAPLPFNKPWGENVRAANNFGPACLQFDAILRGRVMGKEDCLYLNIFTPSVEKSASYPVLVWVHGGGFVAGSSDMYDPKYLMDDGDMVVVSMNYRLASLGFLNTGDHLIRGNMGLKDQNMALRFVRDNIARFGGDKNRVTLFGESAGSASVHYHVISPLSKGLFHRAIMQSGNLFCPWAHTRSPQKQALKFGKSVGCPNENTTVLVACLKRMKGEDIVRQHAAILSPVHTQDDFFPGSVEAVLRNDTFLPDNPYLMLKRGDFNRVPVIFGMNSGEGALKTARLEAHPDIMNTLDTRWDEHVAILLHYNPEMKNISSKIRHFYCPRSLHFPPITHPIGEDKDNSTSGDDISEGNTTTSSTTTTTQGPTTKPPPVVPPQTTLENVTEMISDGVWFHATKQAALHHAKFAPVYLNYFSYHSDVLPSSYTFIKSARKSRLPAEISWPRYLFEAYLNQFVLTKQNHKRFGACHGDDLMYYWSTNPVLQVRPSSRDYSFSRNVVESFSDFVRQVPQLKFQNVIWEKNTITNENETVTLRYMKMDKNGTMIDQPFAERIAFIDSLHIRDPLDPNNW